MKDTPTSYSFGPFELDPVQRLLLRRGKPVPLAPKAVETLLFLVENSGRLVDKEELMKRVWPDTFVEEGNLTTNIHLLRKVLGKGSKGQEYIETIPRRGYRFTAEVKESRTDGDNLSVGASPEPEGAIQAGRELPRTTELQEVQVEAGVSAEVAGTSAPAMDEAHRIGPKAWLGARPLTQAVAAGVALVALVIVWTHLRPNRGLEPSEVKAGVRSIAVLPLKPLNSDPNDEYLGLGMADALITRLGGLHQVVVRPVSEVRKYAKTEQDPIAAGRELKVDTVLDGSIQRLGDRTRITVRALRVDDGTQLWADAFDEKLSDMFALEDSISQKVAGALALNVTSEEQRELSRPSTQSSEAYELYLKGRYFWNKRTNEGLLKGVSYFEQALQIDPQFALSYAGIADSYVLLGSSSHSQIPPREAMSRAKAAAEKALAIDNSLAEAHASLAFATLNYDWDWPAVEKEFHRALELGPNQYRTHHWFSHYLTAMGRTQEALGESKRALELSPTDVVINEHMGWCDLMIHQYDQAIDQCRRTLEMDPGFAQAHHVLGLAYLYNRRYAEAIDEFQKEVQSAADDQVAKALLARAYALSGQSADAKKILYALQDLAKQRYVSSSDIAVICADLGEKDQAFGWLEKAYGERSNSLVYLKLDPAFDSLRSDPRFAALVARIGLPQ
jgi:DNA-binding winged helix-turn-helix (wHTH) protein/TolB-like protein/Flp pilus assembly protein TadD